MKYLWMQATALAVCLCLVYQSAAQAQLFSRPQNSQKSAVVAKNKAAARKSTAAVKKDSSVEQAIAAMQRPKNRDFMTELVDYNTFEASDFSGVASCESGDCGSCNMCFDNCSSCGCCGTNCCGPPRNICQRPGQLFAYADYIYVRPSFSEAQAYVVSDSNQPLQGLTVVEFDFDYQSSYRFGGGYRLCDCDAEIVFNYARYRGESEFAVQDTSASTTTTIFGMYEVNAPFDDGFLFGDADVDVQSYDLGVARTIPLGCRPCNSCCDTCCGGCDTCCDDACCGGGCGGWCPAWDITWSAGVRFADAEWSRGLNSFEEDFEPVRSSITRMQFEGAGARVGLLGRRYFGARGCVSMYAKGDLSILVGDMQIQTTFVDIIGQQLPVRVHFNEARRVIPVTEIEAGVTAHLGKHVNLSGGYLLSAWHDLGMRDEYNFGGNFQLLSYDDANILGFDGLFARAEVAF